MDADEMARETGATPPACFRLHQPVFHFPVFGKGPRVIIARYVERPFSACGELRAQVERRGRVVEQVGFHGPFCHGQGLCGKIGPDRNPDGLRPHERNLRQAGGQCDGGCKNGCPGCRTHCRDGGRSGFRFRPLCCGRRGGDGRFRRLRRLVDIIIPLQVLIPQAGSCEPAFQDSRNVSGERVVTDRNPIGHDVAECNLNLMAV